MLREELKNFQRNMRQPWGVLFYKMAWAQLAGVTDINNLKILDFGSGFGTTANYLAKNNKVIAIEPDADMIEERERENDYTQINGKLESLKDFADDCFDVITCHNVLEFAPERAEIVKEFSRVLKIGGVLSVIKHLKAGKIMYTVVHDNNTDEALSLLGGGGSTNNFGAISYYNHEDFTKWGGRLEIIKILGINMFSRLQQHDEIKHEADRTDKLFEAEMKMCDMEPYKSIAYFNHILLKKEK